TPVFERVQPEEVLIASSHWWAGISAAAARSGARVSDIQYALTSRYAPSFWFGQKPHHGATRFYTWSDFWAERTNVYDEHVVVPRDQPELEAAVEDPPSDEPTWDVCVISQPRVLRRILAFVQELVRERPDLRVVIAPHPARAGGGGAGLPGGHRRRGHPDHDLALPPLRGDLLHLAVGVRRPGTTDLRDRGAGPRGYAAGRGVRPVPPGAHAP